MSEWELFGGWQKVGEIHSNEVKRTGGRHWAVMHKDPHEHHWKRVPLHETLQKRAKQRARRKNLGKIKIAPELLALVTEPPKEKMLPALPPKDTPAMSPRKLSRITCVEYTRLPKLMARAGVPFERGPDGIPRLLTVGEVEKIYARLAEERGARKLKRIEKAYGLEKSRKR